MRDLLAYLRVMVNPQDDISLRRILNVPKRSIGDSTAQALMDHAQAMELPLLETFITSVIFIAITFLIVNENMIKQLHHLYSL